MASTQSVTNGVTELFGATLARQAETAGETLHKLAGALRGTRPVAGRVRDLVGDRLTRASEYLSEHEAGDMGTDVVDLIRRHPVQAAFVGVGIGLALAFWARRRPAATAPGATRLKDVMTRHVESVRPDSPLREAAARMADLDVGAMPVCDGDRLVGMLTDRDIAVRAIARGSDASTPVREVMTSTIRYAYEDEPVDRAREMMKQRKIRRLPILDREKRLMGIVSLGDLAVDTDTGAAGEVLERVSSPARPDR
jgi:CBS domain-containing protein